MNANDEIMQLIIRHLSKTSSGADDLRLQEWLKASPENLEEFEKIKRVWENSGPALAHRVDVDAEWTKFRTRHFADKAEPKVIRFPFSRVITLAAAAVVLLGIFIGIQYLNSPTAYETLDGERLTVSLEDGSEVILGENSVLEVARTFNENQRRVTLQGEGFFTIAKNAEKPFQIDGPSTSTRVLGTQFQLLATTSDNFVKVREGKVAYWSSFKTDTLILTRGEKGALTNRVLRETSIEDTNYESWKTGVFIFENESIPRVLQSLQDYYVFSITNLDQYSDIGCRFSGKFEKQTLDEVLHEFGMIMGMEYQLKEDVLSISKIECE